MTTTMTKKTPVKKMSALKTKKIAAPVEAPSIEAAPAVPEQVIPATVIAKKRAKKSTVMNEAPLPASALAGDPYPIAEEAVIVIEETPKVEVPAWIPVDLIIDQALLVDALTALKPTISTRSTLPILSNVKIVASAEDQTVEIHSTNLEVYGIVTIPTLVMQGGMFTASYNDILDIVKPFKGASIRLSVPEDVLTISCRGMEAQLPTMDAKEYPLAAAFLNAAEADASDESIQETITLPVATFKQMVSLVTPAAADDQSRPVFCGVHFRLEHDVFILEAADAFRVHMMREKIEGAGTWDWTWLIDARSLSTVVTKLPAKGTVTLTTKGVLTTTQTEKGPVTLPSWNSMILTCENRQISFRLIEATFPRVEGVIPKEADLPLSCLVDGASFRQGLDAVKSIVRDASNITRLVVKEGATSIVAAREGMVKPMSVAVEGVSQGEGTAIYNWVYLNAIARVGPPASKLHFQFRDTEKNGGRPVIIQVCDVPGFMGMIMPMSPNR